MATLFTTVSVLVKVQCYCSSWPGSSILVWTNAGKYVFEIAFWTDLCTYLPSPLLFASFCYQYTGCKSSPHKW